MKRARHNLSHSLPFTGNMGKIIPICHYEVLPGDSLRQHHNVLVRLQPLLAPIMHRVDVQIRTFFVPYRIIWDDFEDFITGGKTGEDASVYPTITLTNPATGSLADYLGITPMTGSPVVSAIPFRAYALIRNNYFMDKDLQTESVISTSSGPDSTTATGLSTACWDKDYFTTARPWPQRGDDVVIPLTGDAPVLGLGVDNTSYPVANATVYESDGTTSIYATSKLITAASATANNARVEQDGTTGYPNIRADLSDLAAVDINQLRLASALQRFKEMMAKYGFTYPEYLRQFNVAPRDMRVQWPEYVGGGEASIQFSEVLQTAEGTDPVGELRGHGIGSARSRQAKYFATEHGIMMTVFVCRPESVYADGLHKSWNRRSRYDFFHPAFANLGQQEVLNKEVYLKHTTPDGVFGYQDRWDEYRSLPSRIAGEFRDTLDFWHMARIFDADPALNGTFVGCVPTDRIYATSADQLQCRAINNIKAFRPIPKRSIPLLK